MNKSLRKDLLREIRHSGTRFLSILIMVGLGVMFLVGLRSAAPDMRATADGFFDRQKLFDLQLISTLGLTREDADAVSALEGVGQCRPGVTLDGMMTIRNSQKVVKLHSLDPELNRPVLLSGKLPETAEECAADQSLGLSPGDRIRLETAKEGELACEEFTICGIVQSPLYISIDRGTSTLGDGSVAGFLLLHPDGFALDYVTQLYIQVQGAEALDAYSSAWQDLVDAAADRIQPVLEERAGIRYLDLKTGGRQDLEDGWAEFCREWAKGKQELREAGLQLLDGRRALNQGRKELAQGMRDYADGIRAGQEALEAARAELDRGKSDLAAAEAQLSVGRVAYAGAEALYQSNLTSARQAVQQAELTEAAARAAWTEGEAEAVRAEQAAEAARTGFEEQIRSGISPEEGAYSLEDVTRALLNASLTRTQADTLKTLLTRAEGDTAQSRANLEKTRQEGSAQLAAAQASIAQGEAAVAAGKARLEQGEADYQAGVEELARKTEEGAKTLDDAAGELARREAEYAEGLDAFRSAGLQARDARAEALGALFRGQRELEELKPADTYVLDRGANYGFVSYDQNAERMANLAKMFPVIFFLVAALVCLTTMTRMVEEDRTQIGAIKALGFGTGAIAGKYLAYGVSAALAGSVIGAVIGTVVIPWIIFFSYGIMYILPDLHLQVHWGLCLAAAGAGIACTVGATLWAVLATVRQTPAALMRPKAPKAGKRILLERIKPVWSRLTFSMKVSARNLFRYKKRFWMTVIGVAGCTGLLIAGLGLHTSIFDILDVQFFDLYQYDVQLTLDPEVEGVQERITDCLARYGCDAWTAANTRSVTFSANGATVDGYVTVTEDPAGLARQVRLRDMESKDPMEVPAEGALIDVKLAELLELSVGDRMVVDTGTRHEMTVTGIREHYVYHYAVVTGDYYASITGERPEANEYLISLAEPDEDSVSGLCRRLMQLDGVRGARNKASMATSFRKTMEVVDMAVMVIVFSAAALAFVVLYNLTNINITERIRELATIKVLGFYDPEVAMYVYRENVVLTLFGILLGQFFGKYLCSFLIRTVEMDIVMFGRDPKAGNYLISVLLSLVFAGIVNFFMYFRMKKIDMVQSLKSVE